MDGRDSVLQSRRTHYYFTLLASCLCARVSRPIPAWCRMSNYGDSFESGDVDETTPLNSSRMKEEENLRKARDLYDPGSLREYNLAIKIRHSCWYFIFNIFVLLLCIFLVAWVVRDKGHNPRSRLFFLCETIVTLAIVGDVLLEVSYDGWRAYFVVDNRENQSTGGRSMRYLRCVGNWFQFLVMVLCVVALLVYAFEPDLPDVMTTPEGDTLLSFSLLLVRYTFYVFVIILSSGKTLNLRGCCDSKENWEIPAVDYDDTQIIRIENSVF